MTGCLRAAGPGLIAAGAGLALGSGIGSALVSMGLLAAILCGGATWLTRTGTGLDMSVAMFALFAAVTLRLGGVSAAVLLYLLPMSASPGRTAAVATLMGCLAAGLVIEMIDRLEPVSQETARA